MTSYQRLKQKIAYLEQCEKELVTQRDFYRSAIWDAREAEERLDMSFNPERHSKQLLQIVRSLPVNFPQPGISGDDFLTPYNMEEMDTMSIGVMAKAVAFARENDL